MELNEQREQSPNEFGFAESREKKTEGQLNEKIQMLLDMQEHPENYSKQTLETMLKDPEVHELMEATAQLKQAMTWENASKNTTNVDAEWQRFSKTHYTESKPRRGWLKVAATFIGVLFIAGMAFAAIHIVRNIVEKETVTPTQETQISDSHQPAILTDTIKGDTIVMATPVVFDNVTLDSIAKDIAAYHHIGMDLRNNQARQLRFYFVWKQDDSLQEVVEKLNMFEHVNMAVEDNKLIVR
jgi:hypothetical protein